MSQMSTKRGLYAIYLVGLEGLVGRSIHGEDHSGLTVAVGVIFE